MRLTLRHQYLPADLDGLLFVAPFRDDAKNIYNAGGGIDAAAPATQVVDALGSFIHPATGLITPATANVLRVGSGLDLASRLKGALFEEARTNSCLQSEDFGTTWMTVRSSVATNDIAAPDGNLTADKLVEDTSTNNSHFVTQSITVVSGQKISCSIFAKASERSELLFNFGGAASPAGTTCWFNLSTKSVGTAGAGIDDSGIDDLGNGWYRCWIVFIADANDTFPFLVALSAGSEDDTYTGDGSSGLYLWGAQCEENVPFPSSYIKTTTVAVTRAADDIRFDNTSEVNVKASAGSIYFALTNEGLFGVLKHIVDFNAAGNADGCTVYMTSDDKIQADVRSGGSVVAALVAASASVRGVTEVVCLTWKGSEFTLYVNGIQEAQDTVGAAPTAINSTLYFMQSNTGSPGAAGQLAHFHSYSDTHIAARVLTNSNEVRSWLGLI